MWLLWYERGEDGWLVRRTGWSFGAEGGDELVGQRPSGEVRGRVPSGRVRARAAALGDLLAAMRWLDQHGPREAAIAEQHRALKAGCSYAAAAKQAGSAALEL